MADRYALINAQGEVWTVSLWDGKTAWTPPGGLTAVPCPDQVATGWTYDGKDWTPPVPPPAPVPVVISDRQFFQQLAVAGVISKDEAKAAVATGTIPSALAALVAAIPDEDAQFDAEMKLMGAVEFRRDQPLVATLGHAFGWTDAQIDDLWRAAALL